MSSPTYIRWIALGSFLGCVVLLGAVPETIAEDEAQPATLGEALKKGSVRVDLRYRFENVDQDNPSFQGQDANASTFRTMLTYRSARFHGFDVSFGVEDITAIGLDDDYNNRGAGGLFNGVGDRPAIVDPELTEVALALVSYRAAGAVTLSAGRGELKLGEQRFFGAVGWRQHHQSFDQVRLDVEGIPHTKLTYAFLDRVHRIFGDSQPMNTHALHAEIQILDAGTLTLYGYSLDYEDLADAGLSTRTVGTRWNGNATLSEGWKLPYLVEYATQSDAGDNPSNVDAEYLRAELEAQHRGAWVRAGFEQLAGNSADGVFATPLATLHKWNGWADLFLTTPPMGLEDLYFGLGGTRAALSCALIYHDFSAEGSGSYGTELDLLVSYKAKWGQTFAVKFADYEAEDFGTDTRKIWAYTAYTFGIN